MHGRTYLSQLPVWSQQKLLMPIGARIARQRGYKVWPARLANEATKDATRRSVPGREPGLSPRSATML